MGCGGPNGCGVDLYDSGDSLNWVPEQLPDSAAFQSLKPAGRDLLRSRRQGVFGISPSGNSGRADSKHIFVYFTNPFRSEKLDGLPVRGAKIMS